MSYQIGGGVTLFGVFRKVRILGGKVFYGWWIVAACSLLAALGSGSVYYGFNTFFNPMITEFGWSRTVTSGAFSLSRLEGGIEGVLIGPLIDKFGARIIAIFGVIAAGLGFVALVLVNGNALSLYLIFGIFLSLGYNAFSQRATVAAAAKWFIKKRSRVLAFVTTGSGVGGAVMVPLLAWLIVQYGWRSAAVVIGIVVLTLGLPAAFALKNSPEEEGLLPDGGTISEVAKTKLSESTDTNSKEIDFTAKAALKTSAFWIYTIGTVLRSCVQSAIVVHEIPYLVDMGIDYTASAGILGMMVLLSIPGRLIFGWLGDIFDKRLILFICCMLQAVGIWIFINATSIGMLYVFVVVFGLGYGGVVPLAHAIRGDLFGRKAFATIAGVNSVFTAIGTVVAPVVAGYLYDISHSYVIAFYSFMVMIAMAGFVFLLIRQPKVPSGFSAAREAIIQP